MKNFFKIPNIITISRIFMAFGIFVLILNGLERGYREDKVLIIIVFLLVYLTDYIDGKIARFYRLTTKMGSVLDVLADFLFILFSSTALIMKSIMPAWFVLVIILKLTEFIITSAVMKIENKSSRMFVFDFLGRLAAIMFYLIPMIACICNMYLKAIVNPVTFILTIATTAICILSAFGRVLNCISVRQPEKVSLQIMKNLSG